jgi:hypothetical protein
MRSDLHALVGDLASRVIGARGDRKLSYDERQMQARLVCCVRCEKAFYATDAADHLLLHWTCAGCR